MNKDSDEKTDNYSSTSVEQYSASTAPEIREQLELPLYGIEPKMPAVLTSERLGTFQDSLRAPIHRWFKYPAGFSYKLIEALIEDYNLGGDFWIYLSKH